MCHNMHVEVRRQVIGVGPSRDQTSCGFQRSNSGHRAWWLNEKKERERERERERKEARERKGERGREGGREEGRVSEN